MWKTSNRLDCRYLAIGVLVGVGVYAVNEIQGRHFESKQVEILQRPPDWLEASLQMPDLDLLFDRQDGERPETPASIERSGQPDPWGAAPYIVDGRIQGYRVFPKADRDLFRSLGLRPGDLVTEIDGQPLNDPAVAFALFDKAIRGERVIFSVLRGDGLEKIEIEMD